MDLNKFFLQPTTIVAKGLLGAHLETNFNGRTIGKIVEVEAYLQNDSANHANVGKTTRNQIMFEASGRVYVYLIYGMYYCLNIVTNKKETAEAVLIRAIEPVDGIELMRQRRRTKDLLKLGSGPAKLATALGITKVHNGLNLLDPQSPIKIYLPKDKPKIIQTTRVGISKNTDAPLRFYLQGNKFISKI